MLPLPDDTAERLGDALREQGSAPGRALSGYFYRSPLAYERELDALLLKSWIYAAHVSQVATPGDYVSIELGEDSILVVRGDDGELRAFSNSCRHRGARVCEEAAGNTTRFVCPYHGWVYANDGRLRGAREMQGNAAFNADDLGLLELRLATVEGLVFVNADPAASDLTQAVAPVLPALAAYDLPSARIAHSHSYRVQANWKLCLENYLECYHCAPSHRAYARLHTLKDPQAKVQPQLDALWERAEAVTGVPGIADEHYRIYDEATGFGNCVSHQRYGLFEGNVTGSEDGQPLAPLMGKIHDYDGGAGDFQFGPVSFMLNYPDHCVLYRFMPLGPDLTDMTVVWFVSGEAQAGRDYDLEKLTWLWHHTTLEDEYIISRNRAGVLSRLYRPGPLQLEFEATLMSFHRWYIRAMTAANAQ
ncbi:aromatic ring-hydroxylating oxygenase subunit alpha [Halioglobus pacificus]|uniref:(2Fe-2S)-binding protein n=1 Tax=Parahalioglobus pacificus TaxID=930806 RepID=A0A919CJP2_9GAMM|nr:aromatic ring-hydroxylating dioxygenase subunit alpha [Halioglobus pacificus]GHD31038.1 (2Fe-2S)-binding protein [Halioglobus pacificus]